MTFEELVADLRSAGFLCVVHPYKVNQVRLIVAKLLATPGNHLEGQATTFSVDEDGRTATYDIDEPCPEIWSTPEGYEYTVDDGMPIPPGVYPKRMASAREVYDEVVRFFFDEDSPMRLGRGFVHVRNEDMLKAARR